MNREGIEAQVKGEFEPLALATTDYVIREAVQKAIDYWNEFAGFTENKMVTWSSGSTITLDADMDEVVRLYPSSQPAMPYAITPVWSIFGFDVLDRTLEDVASLWYYIESLRVYLGKDFSWRQIGNTLYVDNVPEGATGFLAVYYKMIVEDEDIQQREILNWLVRYAKAYVTIEEGKRLRKSRLIGVDLDGESMVSDGKETLEKQETWLKDQAIFLPVRA